MLQDISPPFSACFLFYPLRQGYSGVHGVVRKQFHPL